MRSSVLQAMAAQAASTQQVSAPLRPSDPPDGCHTLPQSGLGPESATQLAWQGMLPRAAGTVAASGTRSPLRSRSADLRLTARNSPSTSRPRRASVLMRRSQTCLRCVLSITLTLFENNLTMDLHGSWPLPGCESLMTSYVSAQGSRLLTNHETKRSYVVAPLNQVVDERYTIYWKLAAVGGMGRAIASTSAAVLAATLMLAFGCVWGRKQAAGEAQAELWQHGKVDSAAAAEQVPLRAASATASEMPMGPALASDGASRPAGVTLQPYAASQAAISAATAPGPDVYGGADGSLTHMPIVSSTSAITPTVVGEVHDAVKQRQPVTSPPSGPLRQRNSCASVLSSACEDSDAADDAATSCESFELLAAAE